jgi:hypothetical protein
MDIYDDAEWTALDLEDLGAEIEHGRIDRRSGAVSVSSRHRRRRPTQGEGIGPGNESKA